MSVSPRQNFLNPPPVPEMPTVTLTRALLRLLELLGDRFGDRVDGARPVDGDPLLGQRGHCGKKDAAG